MHRVLGVGIQVLDDPGIVAAQPIQVCGERGEVISGRARYSR